MIRGAGSFQLIHVSVGRAAFDAVVMIVGTNILSAYRSAYISHSKRHHKYQAFPQTLYQEESIQKMAAITKIALVR
jgi:hypothetical protein